MEEGTSDKIIEKRGKNGSHEQGRQLRSEREIIIFFQISRLKNQFHFFFLF